MAPGSSWTQTTTGTTDQQARWQQLKRRGFPAPPAVKLEEVSPPRDECLVVIDSDDH